MKTIRVMLVEDNREYREVISLALKYTPDIELTGQFATAEIALRSRQNGTQPPPDLVLLDLRLPGMDGIAALAGFRACAPQTKIIILTQSNREEDVLQAIRQGASGYLLKSASATELTDSIRAVSNGGAVLDSSVAQFILKTLQTNPPQNQIKNDLSKREMEILTQLAEGLVKKEIADRLRIQYSTVDYYVGRIYEKLNVNNAAAAVNKGHRLGLFSKSTE